VRDLYFVGLTSMHAFGPLYRFVAGARLLPEGSRSPLHDGRPPTSLFFNASRP
jgi:hypothetical protein